MMILSLDIFLTFHTDRLGNHLIGIKSNGGESKSNNNNDNNNDNKRVDESIDVNLKGRYSSSSISLSYSFFKEVPSQ